MRLNNGYLLCCSLGLVMTYPPSLPPVYGGEGWGQAKTEQRTFRVLIDGNHAGKYTQTITTYSEGTTDVAAQADIKLSVLFMTYQFAYRGNERWKEDRLVHLASASNDDGKPHTLMVTAEGGQLKVKESGKERLVPADVWTTSYWTLPAAERRGKPIVLLDSDSGIDYQVQLQLIGKVVLPVGGQRVACTHYKVTGGMQVELWFDEKNRLVRREMMRKGRKAVLELLSVN